MIHAEHFEYETKEKALNEAEELNETNKSGSFKNVLVCFTTIEKDDTENLSEICKRAAQEIEKVGRRIGIRKVLIYPYAHLSDDLAPPRVALKALKTL